MRNPERILGLLVPVFFLVGLAAPATSRSAGLDSPSNANAQAVADNSINVYWRDNSANETGFEVHRSADGANGVFTGVALTDAGVTAWGDAAGLDPTKEYCYRIRAFKKADGRTRFSDFSNTACATTSAPAPPPGPPNAPSNTHVVAVSDSRLDVYWQDNSANESGFEIHRSADGSNGAFTPMAATTADVTARSDPGLNASTQYCYKVRAFNTGGGATSYSDFSTAACATTLAPLSPAAPSDTRVYTASASLMAISWVDNSTSETGFEIYRSSAVPAGAFALVVTVGVNATGASDAGLSAQTEYCYRVRAVRSGGGTTAYSDFSNTACATTPTAPGLHVKTVTTGVDLPTSGYHATIWSWFGFGSLDLPVNGTVDVPGLGPGEYTVRLEDEGWPENCITNNSWQTVEVGGSGVTAEFDLNCTAPKKLAIVNNIDGNTDIYVVNSNGTALTRLTTDPATDATPAWSPDGARIAFASDRTGTWEIFLMNADGSDQVQLTATGSSSGPAWSPDGTRIAFTSYRDGNGEIYVINVDGTGLQNLTNDPLQDDAGPAWSPDGTKIAFSKGPYVVGEEGSKIFLMNADGSDQRLLTADPSVTDVSPAWSPDGASLVVSRLVFSVGTTIWRMSAVDGSAAQVTGVNGDCEAHGDPTTASDGTIAFTDDDWCAGTITVRFPSRTYAYSSGTPIAEGYSPKWRP